LLHCDCQPALGTQKLRTFSDSRLVWNISNKDPRCIVIANTSRQTLLTTDHQVSACSSRACRIGRCPICSVVFFFISCNVGSALCVPTIHAYPSGSYCSATNRPKACPLPGLRLLLRDSQSWRLFCRRFHVEKQARWRSANGLSDALTSAGFSVPASKSCHATSTPHGWACHRGRS
jgi:hypothetical protein